MKCRVNILLKWLNGKMNTYGVVQQCSVLDNQLFMKLILDSGKSHTRDYTHSIGPTTKHILFKNIDQDIHCNY